MNHITAFLAFQKLKNKESYKTKDCEVISSYECLQGYGGWKRFIVVNEFDENETVTDTLLITEYRDRKSKDCTIHRLAPNEFEGIKNAENNVQIYKFIDNEFKKSNAKKIEFEHFAVFNYAEIEILMQICVNHFSNKLCLFHLHYDCLKMEFGTFKSEVAGIFGTAHTSFKMDSIVINKLLSDISSKKRLKKTMVLLELTNGKLCLTMNLSGGNEFVCFYDLILIR